VKLRTVALPTIAVIIAGALAGCQAAVASSPQAQPQPAPTVTVTVTETVQADPTPAPRSPDDAITALDAWLLCSGATYGEYHESSTVFPYSPDAISGGRTVTDKGDGTFQVLVPFGPSSGEGYGAESICVAGGTVGEPSVELQGGRDFG
jgi:hypothetical protein